MDYGDTFLVLLTGFGLSAACGFRVFIPPLIVSIAAQTGNLELTEGLAWLGEWPALIALSIAAVLDSIAHKVSVIDRMLDSVEAPIVAVAGTILSASMVTDMDPLLQWGLAAIAGGGSAEAIHLSRSPIKRPFSTTSDDTFSIAEEVAEEVGLGGYKLLVSLAEDATATAVPISAILFPVFTAFIVVLILVLLVVTAFMIKKYIVKLKKWIVRRRRMSDQTPHSL